MAGILGAALLPLQGLSGFAFGTGYGAGVRFGYEDVYPYLKGNMSEISKMLNIPFASSGFKLASGVTARQGMGLTDPSGGIGTPDQSQGLYQTGDENIEQLVTNLRNSPVGTSAIIKGRRVVKEQYGYQVWLKSNSFTRVSNAGLPAVLRSL